MAEAPSFNPMQLVSTLLPLGLVMGINKLNLDNTDPTTIWSFRIGFIVSVLIYFAITFVLEQKIKAHGQTEAGKTIKTYVVARDQTAIMSDRTNGITEPSKYEYETKSIYEYDLSQLYALRKQSLFPFVISFGIHLWGGYLPPLALQSVSSLLRLFEHQLSKIYFRNHTIERPFLPEASPFASLLGQKSTKEEMDEWDEEQQKKNTTTANTTTRQIKDKKNQ